MNAEPAGRENPHYGKKHMWDFTPPGPDIPSRQPQVMDGMGPRPGPPYKDLRSVRNTAPSPECEASASNVSTKPGGKPKKRSPKNP